MIIAGGGTGGHIYIGIAMALELKSRKPSADFLFAGTRRGLEARIVPQEGFRLEFIDSAGLKGMGLWKLVRNLSLVPRSLLQALRLVKSYDPGVVVGVGGYSSGPVVLAAWWLGKPSLIIEPNAHPGLTNRWLALLVARAALALPDTGGYFRKRGGHRYSSTERVSFPSARHPAPRRADAPCLWRQSGEPRPERRHVRCAAGAEDARCGVSMYSSNRGEGI